MSMIIDSIEPGKEKPGKEKFEEYNKFIKEYLNKNKDKEISINISEDVYYMIAQAYCEGFNDGQKYTIELNIHV